MALFRRTPQANAVIDLRDTNPAAAPAWGSPVPCPSCSGRGYLDHIDPFKEIMYLHCTVCGTKYELNKSTLDTVAS